MQIHDATIYLTDNGAAYCGAHLGATARYTGRDISGEPIMSVTPGVAAEAASMGFDVKCETCGRQPSRLHTAGV